VGEEQNCVTRYLGDPKQASFIGPKQLDLLIKAYSRKFAQPVVVLKGSAPLTWKQRFCTQEQGYQIVRLSKSVWSEELSSLSVCPVIILIHERMQFNGSPAPTTADVLLLPPKKGSHETNPKTTAFYPEQSVNNEKCYLPAYEQCLSMGDTPYDTLKELGIKFYYLPDLPNPDQISTDVYLFDSMHKNSLSMERAILWTYLQPSSFLCSSSNESNNSIWVGACKELLDKACKYSGMMGVHENKAQVLWKLNAYAHILKRRILLFRVDPEIKGLHLSYQFPARGEVNWPYLFVGVLARPEVSSKWKTFLPSLKNLRGEVTIPKWSRDPYRTTHSNKAEDNIPPNFLDPDTSFRDLEMDLLGNFHYEVIGNIDAVTIMTLCLVTMACTLNPTRPDSTGHLNPCSPPNIQIHCAQTGANHAANCRTNVRLWTNEKADSFSAIWDSVHHIEAGDCNALHLPSHFFGTATMQAQRYVQLYLFFYQHPTAIAVFNTNAHLMQPTFL
jgi:hypothetical protein